MARDKAVQAAIKAGKQAWKDARKTKPGSSDFSAPKLKKYGSHKVKVDAKYGLTKNQELYASLIWTIVSGADKGKSHNLYYGIQKEDTEQAQKNMGYLAANVQLLTGVDTSEADFADPSSLFDLLDEIHKDKPIAMADLKEDGDYIKCYFKELVEDESDEESDDEEDDSEDEEDDDAEEDEEEDEEGEEEKPKRGAKKTTKKPAPKSKTSKSKKVEEEDEEEDEEEESEEEEDEDVQEPEKGDIVSYKPPRAKKAISCTVSTINKRAQTVTLKEEDGTKKFADVAWADLEY